MRCHICNSVLSAEEVHFNRKYVAEKYGPFDPCRKCLNAIEEAFDDNLTEEEIDALDEDGYDDLLQETIE